MQQVKSRQITFQTRIKSTDLILDSYAELMSLVERKLFSAIVKGRDLNFLKTEYLKTYQISARQFNSCRFLVEGKIKACLAIKKELLKSLAQRIKSLTTKIAKYKDPNKKHQKKRTLFNLKNKLQNLEKQKT